MKKILILGTSRTASKLFKEVLKKHENVYILHEIMFSFRFKTDIYSTLKKYNVSKNRDNLNEAFDEIYSKPFFRNFKTEFPDKEKLISQFQKLELINWESSLKLFLELKANELNKSITGAKNPVHYSFAPKVLKKLDDVKVLYLLRDPRSIYASEIPMKFKESKLSQFPRLKNKILQRLLIFAHTNIEWIWAMIVYKRLRKKVMLCKYEDLVYNQDKMFQRVFDYCGINYKKGYLEDIGVIGSSYIKNNDRGISQHGVKKWENVLNSFEKGWFKVLIKIFSY
ncbi:MAG: sulfotransferase [Candidatus Woesearchaeota archaeon]